MMLNVSNELSIGDLTTESSHLFIQKEISRVLFSEADSIFAAAKNIPADVSKLVHIILKTTGKIIFSGSGKSGNIAQKITETFSSLGIPSFFLHPHDALHGGLGVFQPNDFFVAISKSAVGDEFEYIFNYVKTHGILTGLICCSNGYLVSQADIAVCLPIEKEACIFNLAPTNSSTLMLAFGDALGVVVSQLRGFSSRDYAVYHPLGTLGKKLNLTVQSCMYKKHMLPLLSPTSLFKDVLLTITQKKLGVGIVIDDTGALKGIITDGDLRRACEQGPSIFSSSALEIATLNPIWISPDKLAYDALKIMQNYAITSLVVVEYNVVIGLIHIHDLIKTGIGN